MGIFSQELNLATRTYSHLRVARDNLGVYLGMAIWFSLAAILIYILINITNSLRFNTWIEYQGHTKVSDHLLENTINNLIAGGIWLTGGAFPLLTLILLIYCIRRAMHYWRHQYENASRDYLFQTISGMIIAIFSMSAFASWHNLPLSSLAPFSLAGGIIGLEINSVLIFLVGKTLTFVIEFLLMITSLLLIFRVSVVKVIEYIGTAVDVLYGFYFLKKGEYTDRSLGQLAKKMRDETLTIMKTNQPEHNLTIVRKTHQTNIFTAISANSNNLTSQKLSQSMVNTKSASYSINRASTINKTKLADSKNQMRANHNPEKSSTISSAVKIITPVKKQKTTAFEDFNSDKNNQKIQDSVSINDHSKGSNLNQSGINYQENNNLQDYKQEVADSYDATPITTLQTETTNDIPPDLDSLFANADNSDFEQTRVITLEEQSSILGNDPGLPIKQQLDKTLTDQDSFTASQSESVDEILDKTIVEDNSQNNLDQNPIDNNYQNQTKPIPSDNMVSINYEQWQNFPLPNIDLLDLSPSEYELPNNEVIELTSKQIESTLRSFGVSVRVVEAYPGPVITSYHIELAQGIKGMQIINLSKDLARSLAVNSIRVVESIPGKTFMGLEIPNKHRQMVKLAEIIASEEYNKIYSALTLAIGKDISGVPVTLNLRRMPHLLVAGTTGSGKSVGVNAMILSMIYKATPNEVRLVMIDPKMVELSIYDDIPHLLAPVITDMKQAIGALNWCVQEMERRQELLASIKVRNLNDFNKKVVNARKSGQPIIDSVALKNLDNQQSETKPHLTTMPYLVVIVDEYADLFMVIGKKIEELIARLAQKGRACGIHLILATQRPSVDVVTGLIKANIPSRIAFQVSSKVDSRTIIDQMGAESLLGHGDMLYYQSGRIIRMHGAFVSDQEVIAVAEYLRQVSQPKYLFEVFEDPTENKDKPTNNNPEIDDEYDQAVSIVIESRNASISYLQRKLSIGFNKAAKLIEKMEAEGIVSAPGKNNKRELLSHSH